MILHQQSEAALVLLGSLFLQDASIFKEWPACQNSLPSSRYYQGKAYMTPAWHQHGMTRNINEYNAGWQSRCGKETINLHKKSHIITSFTSQEHFPLASPDSKVLAANTGAFGIVRILDAAADISWQWHCVTCAQCIVLYSSVLTFVFSLDRYQA